MFKKILLISFVLFLVLGLVACNKRADTNNANIASGSAPDTGKVIDITAKNGQVVFAKPGDALLIKLKDKGDSNFQWSFKEPVSGGYLTLKNHEIILAENSIETEKSEALSTWELKIEKAAEFNIRLEYEDAMARKIDDTFLVKIISDKDKNKVENILIYAPSPDALLKSPIVLKGFARVFEGIINYRLKFNEEILAEGQATVSASAPEFGYFEKEIVFNKQVKSAILEIYQLSAQGSDEADKVIIEFNKE